MRLSSLREDQILRISDEGNDETRAWLQRNVAEIDECSARIAELELALHDALEGCRHYRCAGTMNELTLARQYEDDARRAVLDAKTATQT